MNKKTRKKLNCVFFYIKKLEQPLTGVAQKGENMADFFEKKDAQEENQQEQKEVKEEAEETPTKIKIGEKEYDQDELRELVNIGEIGREADKKYGTKIDGIWPKFTKVINEEKKLRDELKAIKKEKVEEKVSAGEQLSPEERRQQIQAEARNYGLVTDSFLNQWFEKKATEREMAKDLLTDCRRLEKKIDGKDGKPAFQTKDILAYMGQSGVKNAEDAYDLKYKSELNIWRENQYSKRKPSGLRTEQTSTAGTKEPPRVKITKDNLEAAVKESLYGV